MWFEDNGAHACVARVGRRDRVLTGGRAPQKGGTPLYTAAYQGFNSPLEVVQLLVRADANKEARDQVRERMGGDGGLTHGVCVCASCWGLQQRYLLPACCRGFVDRALVDGRESHRLTSGQDLAVS